MLSCWELAWCLGQRRVRERFQSGCAACSHVAEALAGAEPKISVVTALLPPRGTLFANALAESWCTSRQEQRAGQPVERACVLRCLVFHANWQGKVQVQAIVESGWKQMLVMPEGIRWLFPLDFAEAASVAHHVLGTPQDCVCVCGKKLSKRE